MWCATDCIRLHYVLNVARLVYVFMIAGVWFFIATHCVRLGLGHDSPECWRPCVQQTAHAQTNHRRGAICAEQTATWVTYTVHYQFSIFNFPTVTAPQNNPTVANLPPCATCFPKTNTNHHPTVHEVVRYVTRRPPTLPRQIRHPRNRTGRDGLQAVVPAIHAGIEVGVAEHHHHQVLLGVGQHLAATCTVMPKAVERQ